MNDLGVHPSVFHLKRTDILPDTPVPPGESEGRPLKLVVVVPVHNRKAITLQCLRSLYDTDHAGLNLHVIVVDDGSTDGTGDAIRRQFPQVEILTGDGNLRYTKGTNLGLHAALRGKADYILTINDDSIFHQRSLVYMVRCAQTYSRSVVGALLLRWDIPEKPYQNDPKWNTWYAGWRWPQHVRIQDVPDIAWPVEFIPGNCILLPRQAVEEVGLMNERAFPYGWGDAEYTPRVRMAGWQLILEPKARVWIQPNSFSPSLRKLPKVKAMRELWLDRRSYRNLLQTFLRCWYGAPSRRQGLLAFAIFLARSGLKAVGLGRSWRNRPVPEPKN